MLYHKIHKVLTIVSISGFDLWLQNGLVHGYRLNATLTHGNVSWQQSAIKLHHDFSNFFPRHQLFFFILVTFLTSAFDLGIAVTMLSDFAIEYSCIHQMTVNTNQIALWFLISFPEIHQFMPIFYQFVILKFELEITLTIFLN